METGGSLIAPDSVRKLQTALHAKAFRGRRHDLVREPGAGNPHARFDERGEETSLWWKLRHRHLRKPPATATPFTYGRRASPRLYTCEPSADPAIDVGSFGFKGALTRCESSLRIRCRTGSHSRP